jgi:thioredoxin reductase
MRAPILRRTDFVSHGHAAVTLVGSRRTADTLRLQRFLARNGHPVQTLEPAQVVDVAVVGAGPGGLATVVLEAEAPGGQAGTSSRIGPGLLATSLPGVFAVGDVRADSIKRVASAVGEGSIVISSVHAALHDG